MLISVPRDLLASAYLELSAARLHDRDPWCRRENDQATGQQLLDRRQVPNTLSARSRHCDEQVSK